MNLREEAKKSYEEWLKESTLINASIQVVRKEQARLLLLDMLGVSPDSLVESNYSAEVFYAQIDGIDFLVGLSPARVSLISLSRTLYPVENLADVGQVIAWLGREEE